ncbi:MAG: alpha/beta hydrolase [Clostridia bacterium]
MYDWIWYVVLAIVLIALFLFLPSYIATEKIFKKKNKGYAKRKYIETMNGNLSWEWYEKLPKESFNVDSIYGYKLYGEMYRNKIHTNKTVVIMHGYGGNYILSLKYAKMFLEFGFNVVVFDNTNCGRSGGNLTYMGVHEIDDLGVIVAKARELTGENAVIGLHGESMGSATSMAYLSRDDKIAFMIEDCGFTTLSEEVTFMMSKTYHLWRHPYVILASLIAKLRFGFFFKDFSPIALMRENGGYENVPMMFVHGKVDTVVPFEMMQKLYDAKRGYKKKVVFEYAQHARSILYYREEYIKATKDFLTEIGMIE